MRASLVTRQIWSFIGSQKKRLTNLGVIGGAGIATSLISLVTLALNTRGLDPADFGALVSILAYVALCATICSMETWQSIIRLASEDAADIKQICGKTIALDIIAATISFVLALSGIFFVSRFTGLPQEHIDLAVIYSLSLLVGFTGTARGFFRFYDRFDIIAKNSILNSVLTLVASISLWAAGADLKAYVYAFAAAAIAAKLQLSARLFFALRKLPSVPGARKVAFGRIAKMSVSVSFLGTVTASRKNLAILLSSWYLGPSSAALVGAAFRCTAPLGLMTEMVKQVLFSDVIKVFARAAISKSAFRKVTLTTFGMLAVVLAGAGVFALLSGPIVKLVLSENYVGAAPVLGFLLFAEGLYLAGVIFLPIFQARSRTSLLTAIHLVSILGFVVAVSFLQESLDAAGFALIFAVTYLAVYALQCFIVLAPGGLARKAVAP